VWAILCFAGAGLLFFVALHPFVFYPVSLRVVRAIRPRPLNSAALGSAVPNDAAPLSYAICVCAYNEAPIIRTTIENLIALRKTTPDLQILLHVDGNADGTAEIAQEYSDQIDLVVSPERKGKTYGMNRLLSVARAEIVLFTDATVRIDPRAIVNLEKYFQDPTVGCVAGHLRYTNLDESPTAFVGSFYWRLEEGIKQLESDTGSVMGADGSIYAIRRELFTPVPEDMIDDMFISLRVLCDGYRIVRAPDVYAYEKSVTDSREEFRRKIRIACQAFAAHSCLRPALAQLGALDRYKYISHKLVRWFTAYTLAAVALLFVIGVGLTWGPVAAAAGTLAALGLLGLGYWVGLRPVTMVADILVSFIATAIGVWKAGIGHRIRTWEPASSIRKA
jgi:cellulose synthase/poly-beta-1,6-N-acetylglucosamine synthase-like glycosyltransferase